MLLWVRNPKHIIKKRCAAIALILYSIYSYIGIIQIDIVHIIVHTWFKYVHNVIVDKGIYFFKTKNACNLQKKIWCVIYVYIRQVLILPLCRKILIKSFGLKKDLEIYYFIYLTKLLNFEIEVDFLVQRISFFMQFCATKNFS